MNPIRRCYFALHYSTLFAAAWSETALAATYAELDTGRIIQITSSMSASPRGLGPRCTDRSAWRASSLVERLLTLPTAADKLLTQAFPAWDDDAYLEFAAKGTRQRGERMMKARLGWLYPLVLAECVEGKRRFLPAIERALTELDAQPTWTLPATDSALRNFRKHDYEVDLWVADTAHDVAQTLYMLDDLLSPAVKQQTMAVLEARVFAPMRRSFAVGGKNNWWLQTDSNWNPVCLTGVVGAALAVLPDRQDRAMFVAAGEHYIRKYVAAFPRDGYSLEGPGYWNYGFAHFAQLRELLMQATIDTVDLFANPKVRNIALYGFRVEMAPGNVAAFGDAPRNAKMDGFALAYANQAFKFGLKNSILDLPITAYRSGNSTPVVTAVMSLFTQPAQAEQPSVTTQIGVRSYFDQAGVLISRPAVGGHFGVAIKAGGNGYHSHNDIGSYAIGLGTEQPTGDLGTTVYSAKTFSNQRYTIKGINSFGHPVPVVAGELQREATKLKPTVLETRFSEQTDEITLDMAAAYPVESLKKLTRTLRHERTGVGAVQIEDHFEFTSPQTFEGALIAGNNWQDRGNGKVELWQKAEHIMASIETSAPYELITEKVDDEGLAFTRIGIRLEAPAHEGYIRVRFVPI